MPVLPRPVEHPLESAALAAERLADMHRCDMLHHALDAPLRNCGGAADAAWPPSWASMVRPLTELLSMGVDFWRSKWFIDNSIRKIGCQTKYAVF
jgi:hypothetical protein